MTDRSLRPDVRNPVLALPSAVDLANLPPEAREALAAILKDIRVSAHAKAQESWRKNKGPMAVYWKAVGAYATHIYRAVRP
jgi:hypothetical protein